MIRTVNSPHHLRTILSFVLVFHLISSSHLDQSSENFNRSSASVNEPTNPYTCLAIKLGVQFSNIHNTCIDKKAKTYLDLIENSNVFLDTSLFVEEILKNYTEASTLLACPNKWGKTINLDMLKTFLEIQVDQNGFRIPRDNTTTYRLFRHSEIVDRTNQSTVYKLYSPLLISKNTALVDRHQGKHPVVFFSLKEVVGDNLASIREAVRKALSRAFQPHTYLIADLAKDARTSEHLALFEQMLNGTAKNEDIPDGLILLCHCLEGHFNEKVVLLVDDYDAFVHHLLQSNRHTSDQFAEIVKFMAQVVDTALRRNLHMEFGIATGVLQINAFHWELHNHTVYVKDREAPISEYFGFTRSTFQKVCSLYIIFPKRAEADVWYRGYAFEEPAKFFYNPYSMAWFLDTRISSVYRDEGQHEALMHDILRDNRAMRNTILEILSKKVVAAEKRYPYMIEDLKTIRSRGNHLLTYLSDKGYLSTITNNPLFNHTENDKLTMISVAIPGEEITHQIAAWMKTYCIREYDINPLVFNYAGAILKKLIENQPGMVTFFQKCLQEVYTNSSNLKDKINLEDEYVFPDQEHPVHLIFDCVCLRAQYETSYTYEMYYKKLLKADIVAIKRDKKRAAIIQMKFKDETPDRAMAQAENYLYIFDENDDEVEIVNLIGISVSINFTVRVESKLVERKPQTKKE